MWLRRTLIGLACVAVIAATFVGVMLLVTKNLDAGHEAKQTPKLGGPFELTDTSGRKVTEKDLLGKPTAIYFGYTYCPEACPTTMLAMTNWMKDLGPKADKMNFVFITIDPERDKPAEIKLYLTSFDPRIKGFTGTPAETKKVAQSYMVYYHKTPSPDGNYLLDHTSMVYLMDRRGKFVDAIAYQAPLAQAESQLRALIK
jgi:protein SCO1/2